MVRLWTLPEKKVRPKKTAPVSRVIPNQSMTLQEIIKRFVRKESLPIMKEGTYNEDYEYDLEKLVHADITERHDVINHLKYLQQKAKQEYEKSERAKQAKIDADKLIQSEPIEGKDKSSNIEPGKEAKKE